MNLITPVKANKPQDVNTALILLFASIIIGRLPKILQLFQANSSQVVGYLPEFFIPITLAYFIFYMAWKGQNWARICIIIFVILNIISLMAGLSNPYINSAAKIAASLEEVFAIFATYLLFKKSSNEWFDAKN